MFDRTIYDKLTSYCAYQERCAADVRGKLFKLKTDKEDFGSYIERLTEENFLNEERYVKSFIEAHAKKKWGKTKMKSALLQKQMNSGLIKKYLDEIVEEDYTEHIKLLAEKKLRSIKSSSKAETKTKLMRHLLNKGYEMQKISGVLKELKL
ncbi:MAG: RecX family transcriptional regulator [Bacteroidetes bacterium]|nr:RecX family transcriptional regulator [Bacteroidota bacterium]